ncbi:MAG: HEAT repeat domain-containing protein, partial [Planctomycetes bacterium]|nr:HEAT repeat domain-containing protein [Planctomycetota bacterium]
AMAELAMREPATAAARLVELCEDADDRIRQLAARALARPEVLSVDVQSVVRQVIERPGPWRTSVVPALMSLRPRETSELLAEAAQHDEELESRLVASIAPDEDRMEVRVACCGLALRPEASAAWKRLYQPFAPQTDSTLAETVRAFLIDPGTIPWLRSALRAPVTLDDPEALDRAIRACEVGMPAERLARVERAVGEFGLGERSRLALWVRFAESPDATLFEPALTALLASDDPRTLPVMLDALPKVRSESLERAVLARLWRFGHPAGRSGFIRIFRDEGSRRGLVLETLVGLNDLEARQLAESVLDRGDVIATFRLVQLYHERGLSMPEERRRQLLAEPLMDPFRWLSYFEWMADTLGRAEAREFVSQALLENRVFEAARALDWIALPPVEPLRPLITARLSDADPRVRATAVKLLGVYGPQEHLVALQDRISDDDPLVRAQLAWALGRVSDPVARGGLIVLARDSDPQVREVAVNSLGSLPTDDRIWPALEARLRDDSASVQLAARMALVRGGRMDELPRLFGALDESRVRPRVLAYLQNRFEKAFEDRAHWKAWWEAEGQYEFGGHER